MIPNSIEFLDLKLMITSSKLTGLKLNAALPLGILVFSSILRGMLDTQITTLLKLYTRDPLEYNNI